MAIKLFTNEQIEYLRQIVPGNHNEVVTEQLNKRFGTSYTPKQVKNCRHKHHIKSGKLKAKPCKNRLTTEEQNAWLRENAIGKSAEEIRLMIKEKLGLDLTPEQVKGLRGRHGINNGIDTKFRRGHVPMNKGVKMSPEAYKKCAPTMFKKGNVPANHKPLGSERITVDGYIEVKVAEPNKWAFKHRLIWEKAYGEISKGKIVIFVDSNKLNCELSNLLLVDRAVHGVMNCHGLRSDLPEITKINVKLAEMLIKKDKRKRELKNGQKENRKGKGNTCSVDCEVQGNV